MAAPQGSCVLPPGNRLCLTSSEVTTCTARDMRREWDTNLANRAPARASPLIVDRYLRNTGGNCPQSRNRSDITFTLCTTEPGKRVSTHDDVAGACGCAICPVCQAGNREAAPSPAFRPRIPHSVLAFRSPPGIPQSTRRSPVTGVPQSTRRSAGSHPQPPHSRLRTRGCPICLDLPIRAPPAWVVCTATVII